MHSNTMRTMNKNINPEIRVYPHIRQQLKIMAAQKGMTMIDLVAWLVEQEQKRQKGANEHADTSV